MSKFRDTLQPLGFCRSLEVSEGFADLNGAVEVVDGKVHLEVSQLGALPPIQEMFPLEVHLHCLQPYRQHLGGRPQPAAEPEKDSEDAFYPLKHTFSSVEKKY